MPSAASAAQREAARLASLTFFLDHQIGRYQVAEALRTAGAKAAYESAKLRGFVATGKDMNAKELSDLLVRCLPGMVRRAAGRKGPLLFMISRVGVFAKLI